MSFLPGLVSVTFRNLTPAQIVAAAARAGLRGIEWGGDVHVPHGDLVRARVIRGLTTDGGLKVAAYGSYYRFDESALSFAKVLETAVELGAPVIRVWAGSRGSAEVTSERRATIVSESRRIAELAASAGIVVCYESHGDTLTDQAESARQLLRDVDHPNMRTLWQPPNNRGSEYCSAELQGILPWLENIHCFHWSQNERRPLADGAGAWSDYLALAGASTRAEAAPLSEASRRSQHRHPEKSRWVLLEFVANDSVDALIEDASTLRGWLGAVSY